MGESHLLSYLTESVRGSLEDKISQIKTFILGNYSRPNQCVHAQEGTVMNADAV